MAGVMVRMFICSRASFSTRSGVACARRSTSKRSCSVCKLRAKLVARSISMVSERDSYCVRTKYKALAITAIISNTLTRLMPLPLNAQPRA